MTFTNEDVKKLAKLARLHITEEETKDYQEKLGSILEYIEQLQEVDTTNVPELQSASGAVNVFRSDEIESASQETVVSAIKLFTHKQGNLLEVQAAISGRAGSGLQDKEGNGE